MNAQIKVEPSLISALAKALPELESAKKNKANPAFKSKYADLGAVIEALEPITHHGLWYRQHQHENENGAMVETFYIHESGQEMSAGTVFMPATKRDAQGFGSALSYARRYGLQCAFGLATEDDDGNAAAAASKKEREAPKEPVITHEQVTELMLLIPAAQMTPAKFNQSYNIKDVTQLPVSKFEEAKDRLQTRMAALAKKATEEQAKEPA